MAKKIKRKVSSVGQAAPVGEPVEVAAGSGSVVSTPARAIPNRRVTYTQEFNPDYTYVKNDLKRIGILAGSFFALLIILAFVMPYIMP
jgi:hypothetical protein